MSGEMRKEKKGKGKGEDKKVKMQKYFLVCDGSPYDNARISS